MTKKSLDKLEKEAVEKGLLSKDEAKEIKESIEGSKEFSKRVEYEQEKWKIDEAKILLGKIFEDIRFVLKKYIKLKEEYYDFVAVWVIGTYFMEEFSTYPYLFINAQKGSGKTRMLKLLESITKGGELLVSMREAVLFRLADKGNTILIDELENLNKKENYPLRELLNACYKKGMKVYRNDKNEQGKWELIPFFPFAPIVIANISGTDDVLGDRCVTIRLDKSSDKTYSSRQEDFDKSPLIQSIKKDFEQILVYVCRLCSTGGGVRTWNIYQDSIHINHTLTTHTTYTTPISEEKEVLKDSVVSVYNKIEKSGLTGRALELIFPLLMVALKLNDEVFERILNFSKEIMDKKKDEDLTESKDVSLIEFISKMSSELDYGGFRFIHELTDKFRFFMGIRDKWDQQDINATWLGRALKRLGLVIEKRRLSAGIEVKLNVIKATKLLENLK